MEKIFKTSNIEGLLNQYYKEEISVSYLAEKLNEIANDHLICKK